MILMQANSFQGPLEGEGPEMATIEATAIWAQKVDILYYKYCTCYIFIILTPSFLYSVSY
jgi:hypothetical protein